MLAFSGWNDTGNETGMTNLITYYKYYVRSISISGNIYFSHSLMKNDNNVKLGQYRKVWICSRMLWKYPFPTNHLDEYFSKAVDKKFLVLVWVTTNICYRTLHVIIYFFIVFQAQKKKKKKITKPYSARFPCETKTLDNQNCTPGKADVCRISRSFRETMMSNTKPSLHVIWQWQKLKMQICFTHAAFELHIWKHFV